MDNSAISKVFADVAVLMQAKGENIFKVRAHSKASDAARSLPFQIRDIVDDADRLGEIPGFGKAIVEKTQELIWNGFTRKFPMACCCSSRFRVSVRRQR